MIIAYAEPLTHSTRKLHGNCIVVAAAAEVDQKVTVAIKSTELVLARFF